MFNSLSLALCFCLWPLASAATLVSMRVGYYQNNPSFGEVARNLDQIEAKLEQAETELLVLPEFCASGYQFVSQGEVRQLSEPVPDGLTTQRLLEIARKRRMVIVAGLPE